MPMIHDNDTLVLPSVKYDNTCNDKIVQQLLKKLDQGTETIINLRSLLTLKTTELNEIIHQLELIDQVLTNVENGTEQIEGVLKDVISTGQQDTKLLDAEATLDSAIKSAYRLYSIDDEYSTEKEILLEKIGQVLIELNHISTIHAYEKDDIKVLQKAFVDLNLAKTIATNVKDQFKHRNKLLKNKHHSIEKIKQLDDEMKKQAILYKSYTRNKPLLVNGKDIITLLDREETAKMHSVTKQRHCLTVTNTNNKKRQVNNNNQHKSTLQMIARPTLTSMAKSKEKKVPNPTTPNGPGSTLRLRNMLAKRNPLKMINNQAIVV